jgi:hypothetical protein
LINGEKRDKQAVLISVGLFEKDQISYSYYTPGSRDKIERDRVIASKGRVG